MHSKMDIGENSKVTFKDIHYHGASRNIQVDSNYDFLLKKNSEIKNYFELTEERAGILNLHTTFSLDQNAKAYTETKLKEKHDDKAVIEELIYLYGDFSSGIAKTYIVGENESNAEVINEVYTFGNHTTGHIECDELIAGEKVTLSAIPKLVVTNNTSEITHEAAVGRLNTEQSETLMTKGLTEEEATEMIINGIFDD
ncbi:MAG: SufD family Fe-S cluster assembly protein [Thermotogota bacterium]|nr:SufD family Fe-S cluster assembly protein [Thermotogota bacterium]